MYLSVQRLETNDNIFSSVKLLFVFQIFISFSAALQVLTEKGSNKNIREFVESKLVGEIRHRLSNMIH